MPAASASQRKLDPETMTALSGSRTPKFLATRDDRGTPNVVPVLSLEAVDERTIIFAELMIWKTRRNLETDPRVSILAISADLRAWTIKGRFLEFQRSGAYYDHLMKSEDVRYNAYSGIRSAGVIEVLAASRKLNFSRAGLLVDTLRSRWLARRVSGNNGDVSVMPPQVREKFDRLSAAKAVAFLDDEGHPECLPAMAMASSGSAGLVWGGSGSEQPARPRSGQRVAAAVITMEPVAYQVKGQFQGWRSSLGRKLGTIWIQEAYSASPPLPGKRLPGAGTLEGDDQAL
jgi:hypothetical protein